MTTTNDPQQQPALSTARVRAVSITTRTVLQEVASERFHQDEQWGGADHDDDHNIPMWLALITKHAGRAYSDSRLDPNFRRKMVTVAALAVAAVEWADRQETADRGLR